MEKSIDIVGKRFGRLIAIEKSDKKGKHGEDYWIFNCDCGNIKEIMKKSVIGGHTKSCGCLHRESVSVPSLRRVDLAGKKFGKLNVLEPVRNGKARTYWKCKCDCGNEVIIQHGHLVNGHTKSCGCFSKEKVIDLTGRKFNKLTAIKKTYKENRNESFYVWKCECGKEIISNGYAVKSGRTKSCGCVGRERFKKLGMESAKDLSGQRYGRLTAIKPTNLRDGNNIVWECLCDCGKTTLVNTGNLCNNHTRSCGCLVKEIAIVNGKRNYTKMRIGKDNCLVLGTSVDIIRSKKINVNNKTGIKGVSFIGKKNKYRAEIGFRGKTYYLGEYTKLDDAAKVRKKAEEMLFEPFLEWYDANFKKESEEECEEINTTQNQ